MNRRLKITPEPKQTLDGNGSFTREAGAAASPKEPRVLPNQILDCLNETQYDRVLYLKRDTQNPHQVDLYQFENVTDLNNETKVFPRLNEQYFKEFKKIDNRCKQMKMQRIRNYQRQLQQLKTDANIIDEFVEVTDISNPAIKKLINSRKNRAEPAKPDMKSNQEIYVKSVLLKYIGGLVKEQDKNSILISHSQNLDKKQLEQMKTAERMKLLYNNQEAGNQKLRANKTPP